MNQTQQLVLQETVRVIRREGLRATLKARREGTYDWDNARATPSYATSTIYVLFFQEKEVRDPSTYKIGQVGEALIAGNTNSPREGDQLIVRTSIGDLTFRVGEVLRRGVSKTLAYKLGVTRE